MKKSLDTPIQSHGRFFNKRNKRRGDLGRCVWLHGTAMLRGITESKESGLESRMVRESTKEKVRTRLSLKESLGIEVATT